MGKMAINTRSIRCQLSPLKCVILIVLLPFKVPPQVLNLMAKLVEEGEMAMGIAEESE